MHYHCGTNNRAPRWTFTDSCKPEVRPGAQEESASPAWLAAPAMNVRDTTKCKYGGLTLDVDRYYLGSVTATTHQEKGIITLYYQFNYSSVYFGHICVGISRIFRIS